MSVFDLSDQNVGVSSLVPGLNINTGITPASLAQIIELATGSAATPAQMVGWELFEHAGGSATSIVSAFVGSTAFADNYNNGIPVDPNSPITPTIAQGLIEHALGSVSAAQVNAWAGTGLSVAQVFGAFASGDQFATLEAPHNAAFQTQLWLAPNQNANIHVVGILTPLMIVDAGALTGGTTDGGTTTTGISISSLSGVGSGSQIVFDNAPTESLANLAGSGQINVSAATSLAQALDLAAADASASQPGGAIPGDTGLIDWFQYNGSTFVVEAINPASTPVEQTALTASDSVVSLVGLIDLSTARFADHTLTI